MSHLVVHELDPTDAPAVRKLVDTVTAARGHPPIDQGRLNQALDGDAPGCVAALAWDRAHAHLTGYVQAVRSNDVWDIELAVHPPSERLGRPPGDLAEQMLQAVLDDLAAEGDAGRRLWAYQATEDDDRLAASVGLSPTREVRQLRRGLPVPAALTADPVATRPFVVGKDEHAWVEVNNRAFAWHPEQGGWTVATMKVHEQEPWFDPGGFLLHEVDGKLAGFCWTKVHHDTHPPLGEIYVIGVDPAFQGRGLGRALVLAGLDHLATTGLTVGMLYVDAGNAAAVRLYADLGFEVHHVDRVYSKEEAV